MWYIIGINVILLSLVTLLFTLTDYSEDTMYYTNNIRNQIMRMIHKTNPNDKNESFFLGRGNMSNIICFFMNIVAFLSLKAELYITHETNYESWKQANFEVSDKVFK